jgi:methionine-rich copper-binding protein CopC
MVTPMMRFLSLAAAVLLAASPAWAHAFLQHSTPPVGSASSVAPPAVAISFTEAIEPAFSTIEVHAADGAAVQAGTPHLAPGNARQLIVDLPKLPPGIYTVIWHATSVDTHKTSGRFEFTVTP